jgi:methylmalonyl-CoA epimerase
MFKRLDHVVIAVSNVEEAARLYGETLGFPQFPGESIREVGHVGVGLARFDFGNAYLGLVQPANENAAVAKFIRERGEGLYILAIQVDDLKGTVGALREKGVRIVGDENAEDPRVRQQLFIHPKSTRGAIIQLVE